MEQAKTKKSALTAIIGRPSVGKSTFLNAATGEKVSIVSPVPQTTRNAVRGMVNTPQGQLVFIDTPGYHESEKKFNLKLQALVRSQLEDIDLTLYMMDASRPCGAEEELTAALAAPLRNKLVIAVNKLDLCPRFVPGASLADCVPAHITAFISSHFGDPVRVIPLSAENNLGVQEVVDALFDLAPEGDPYYPEEYYTDQEVDFRIAEVIREQAINRLHAEIPHAVYVEIADMERRGEGKTLWVRAFLWVETESQKGIVIGKGASLIKTIRVESIKALRKIFPYRVDLDLQVKVRKNWRQKVE
ncbi:MAG: GTPase Era [Treponema sp.]|jgi:GTP-binding protein Era|nr:GTPase Era [Treponema sp.]